MLYILDIYLQKEGEGSVAIESVVAVPEDSWNLDYVKPKPVCVRKNGKCVQSTFYTPAEAKKVTDENYCCNCNNNKYSLGSS